MKYWNIKVRFFLIIILTYIYNIDILADGSPIVQSIIAKDSILFISENGGLYTIFKKGDHFYWNLDEGYSHIVKAPDGRIWIKRMNGGVGNIPNKLRCFYENKWTEFEYPKIKDGNYIRYFFINGKTYIVIEDYDNSGHVLFFFDDNLWKKLTHFPDNDYSISSISQRGDFIVLTAKDQNDYYYSITSNEWKKTVTYEDRKSLFASLPSSQSDTFGRGYKMERENVHTTKAIVSPEGNRFTLNPDMSFSSMYCTYDNEGYAYIQTNTIPYNDNMTFALWSDRNGQWEKIATGKRELSRIVFSDDPDKTIWGSDGKTYLAFLRDGQWIEIALLPPEQDCGCGDEEHAYIHPMHERFNEAKNMILGVINDPDGYVNVRSQPGAWSPVKAIILRDISFLYQSIENSQWSKVLLPSGTIGYISNDRIRSID